MGGSIPQGGGIGVADDIDREGYVPTYTYIHTVRLSPGPDRACK